MGLVESSGRRGGVELSRSPSAPGLVSSSREDRAIVLADGSCAFNKGRRNTLGTKRPQDCHLTLHNPRGSREEDVEPPVALEEITDPVLLQDVQMEAALASAAMLRVTPDPTIEEDGSTFRGFIRVHMNLCRPISVVAGTRPPSIYDILKEDKTIEKTLTSFYLPRDTVKALHITSETTTREVITVLLQKFKVVDNPRKFALYERFYEKGDTVKVKMRRIGETEKPLVLALRWSRETDSNKMFVLQENETGDILWEAFSVPELNNFLRILDREEEEYKRIVQQKYQVLGRKIQEAMEKFRPPLQQIELSSEEKDDSTHGNS